MSSPHASLPPIKANQLPDSFPEFENCYNHPCPIQISINIESTPKELHNGLKEIAKYTPHKNIKILDQPEGSPDLRGSTYPYEWCISFHHDACMEPGNLSVKYFPTASTIKLQVYIEYNRSIEAFKAFGILLGLAFETRKMLPVDLTEKTFEEMLNFSKKAQFETLCLMIDCSRNAVTSVPTLFKLIRFSALMGYNMLQLYTEDTYEIKGEPFFGFCRGGYTQVELATIDNYAYDLGIEVVPCIQTLGHLGQILQWPHYNNLKDTNEVLLTRFNETYDFIEKMLVASSQPLRSKRIHLGMDEAYGLGEGRFRQFFGQEDNTKIFVDHLARLKEICQKHQLKPMIWSDMLFCLGAKNMSLASYYDENSRPAAINLDPGNNEELELVFWDYYHTSPDIYIQKFRNHRELGCASPWMAAGAWTWSRFWCAMQFSIKAAQACLQASKDPVDGVRNFMLTLWGDEGSECDYFSSLPIMMYTSIQAYSPETEVSVNTLEAHFAGVCGGNLRTWYKASQLDELPFDNEFKDLSTVQVDLPPVQFPPNTSKHLLWEDPFYAIFSPSYAELDLEMHYAQLYSFLSKSIANAGALYPLDHHLRLPLYLAKVLSLKVNLRSMLVELYRRGQRQELRRFAAQRIGELRSALVLLWNYHRSLWYGNNKPFGWEVLELRYGGLLARVDTLASRISDYCDYSSKLILMPGNAVPDPDSMEIDHEESSCRSLTANGLPDETVSPHISPVQITSLAESPSMQLAVWPDHSVYPNGELNFSIASIPEFEVETLTPFIPSRHNMIIEYSRASSVSRLG